MKEMQSIEKPILMRLNTCESKNVTWMKWNEMGSHFSCILLKSKQNKIGPIKRFNHVEIISISLFKPIFDFWFDFSVNIFHACFRKLRARMKRAPHLYYLNISKWNFSFFSAAFLCNAWTGNSGIALAEQ